jgi:hypothetical protein
LFTIIISIWPWSVYSLPESRQLDRLEKNLTKAWIIKIQEEMYNYTIAKKIIPLKNVSDIEKDLSKNIYDWIDYLCDFDNCNQIKNLFPIIYKEILEKDKKDWEKDKKEDLEKIEENKWKKECEYHKKYWYAIGYDECYNSKRKKEILKRKYKWPSKWTIVDKITDKIKVERYFYESDNIGYHKYISFSPSYTKWFFPIELKWYKKIYTISEYKKSNKIKNNAEYYVDEEIIIIKENWKEIDRFSTKKINKILTEKYKKYWKWKKDLYLNDYNLIFELNKWKYKLIFTEIKIKNPDYDNKSDFGYYNTSWYLLVK